MRIENYLVRISLPYYVYRYFGFINYTIRKQEQNTTLFHLANLK